MASAGKGDSGILKQAVSSTRKSQSDLSFEVNDDFNPGIEAEQGQLPLLVLADVKCDTDGAGSMKLITDVKKVE